MVNLDIKAITEFEEDEDEEDDESNDLELTEKSSDLAIIKVRKFYSSTCQFLIRKNSRFSYIWDIVIIVLSLWNVFTLPL